MTSLAPERPAVHALQGVQEPRLCALPDDVVSSAGEEAVEVSRVAGLELDPWEQLVLMQALGERADGSWAAFEVGTVVPRQNGKDAILEARELAGLFLFDEKLLIHSAHEQATATEHFLRLLNLIEGTPDFDKRVMKAPKGKGAEAIELRGKGRGTIGQRIKFKTRTGGGGRGFTGDFVAMNEAMMLPAAFMGALVPTMAARSITGNPQLWYAGSAVDQNVTEHGIVLARLRARALGGDPRIAYFEWSIEGDDPDDVPDAVLHDPAAWAIANPGLGIRISTEHIAAEAGALGRRAFSVERLGVGDWPDTEETDEPTVVDLDVWSALTDRSSKLVDPACLAIDVRPSFTSSAIAAAGRRPDGLHHVELVEHRPGTGWLVDELVGICERNKPTGVLYDERSPSAAVAKQALDRGVPMQPVSGRQHAEACGRLLAEVEQRTVRHRGDPAVAAAIRVAGTRPLGDAWAWSRRSSKGDICPLVAVTLALWGQDAAPAKKPFDPDAYRIGVL